MLQSPPVRRALSSKFKTLYVMTEACFVKELWVSSPLNESSRFPVTQGPDLDWTNGGTGELCSTLEEGPSLLHPLLDQDDLFRCFLWINSGSQLGFSPTSPRHTGDRHFAKYSPA
ncbi:hypothetical protein Tco_0352908 [Tanacetum coccineum]